MMSLLYYSLLLSVLLMLLWSAYKAVGLGRSRSFGFGRGVLMGGVLFCLAAAALPWMMRQQAPEVIEVTVPDQEIAAALPSVIANAPSVTHNPNPVGVIYITGVALWLLWTLVNVSRVVTIALRSQRAEGDGHVRLHTDSTLVPFNWGRWVVMSRQDYAAHGPMLLAHENAHRHAMHWLDLLVLNTVGALTWYCPAIPLLRRALLDAHEYHADAAVMAHGFPAAEYQMLLIEKASGRRFANSVTTCINHVSLKNRITMMLKPSPSRGRRALVLIPVAALALTGVVAVASLRPAPAPIFKVVPIDTPAAAPAQDDEKVFSAVEQMPTFPGGDVEMWKFLSSQIRYPENAAKNNIQGRVTVRFVVKKDGSIGEIKVVRGKDPELDAEAVRVISLLPKFNPGKVNGEPVNVYYTLPILFKLSDPVKSEPSEDGVLVKDWLEGKAELDVFIDGKKATPDDYRQLVTDGNVKSVDVDKSVTPYKVTITTNR